MYELASAHLQTEFSHNIEQCLKLTNYDDQYLLGWRRQQSNNIWSQCAMDDNDFW